MNLARDSRHVSEQTRGAFHPVLIAWDLLIAALNVLLIALVLAFIYREKSRWHGHSPDLSTYAALACFLLSLGHALLRTHIFGRLLVMENFLSRTIAPPSEDLASSVTKRERLEAYARCAFGLQLLLLPAGLILLVITIGNMRAQVAEVDPLTAIIILGVSLLLISRWRGLLSGDSPQHAGAQLDSQQGSRERSAHLP